MKNAQLYTLIISCRVADVKEKLYNEAMSEYEADFTNEALEAAADEAYKDYYNSCRSISEKICEITENKVDPNTALTMAFDKRSRIEELLQHK